jgi:hypothetical protein
MLSALFIPHASFPGHHWPELDGREDAPSGPAVQIQGLKGLQLTASYVSPSWLLQHGVLLRLTPSQSAIVIESIALLFMDSFQNQSLTLYYTASEWISWSYLTATL